MSLWPGDTELSPAPRRSSWLSQRLFPKILLSLSCISATAACFKEQNRTQAAHSCPRWGQQPPLVILGGYFVVFSAAELYLERKKFSLGFSLAKGKWWKFSEQSAWISSCPCNVCMPCKFCLQWKHCQPQSQSLREHERGNGKIWWIKCLTLVVTCRELQFMCFSLADNRGEKNLLLHNITNTENYCGFFPPHFPLLLYQQEGFGGFWALWLQFWILISVLFLGF